MADSKQNKPINFISSCFDWKINKFAPTKGKEGNSEFYYLDNFKIWLILNKNPDSVHICAKTVGPIHPDDGKEVLYYKFKVADECGNEMSVSSGVVEFSTHEIVQIGMFDTLKGGNELYYGNTLTIRFIFSSEEIDAKTDDINRNELPIKLKCQSPSIERGIQTQELHISECQRSFIEKKTQTEDFMISDSGAAHLLSILSRDFEKFYANNVDTDFILIAGSRRFPVHRTVLSARSPVFAAMFRHDTAETTDGKANIEDVDEDILNCILHYMYSSKIRGLDENTAVPIFYGADKYGLLELKQECLNFLLNNLHTTNVCDAAYLAHIHEEADLEAKVVDFIDTNMEEVLCTESWKKFFDTKPAIAGKFIYAAYRACKMSKRNIN